MEKPLSGVRYKISGTHAWGDWSTVAVAKFYSDKNQKSLSAYQRKFGYRWIAENGNVIKPHEVESFVVYEQEQI